MDSYHIAVLLDEAIKSLNVRPAEKYIDCTFGGGGHTARILKTGGKVLAIDQDQEAIDSAQTNFPSEISKSQLILRKNNFAHLKTVAVEAGFEKVAGVLFDLGVSSHQLETDYRGFSFGKVGKLDMRMDPTIQTVTAADLVNAGGEKELAGLFWRLGQERESHKIAKAIVTARKTGPIRTTNQLADIILSVSHRGKADRTHPATRVFQALRIAVNDELESLKLALPQAVDLLKPGGRVAAISFHSLEDRIVKDFFKSNNLVKVITDKPITPAPDEINLNPRARSGKLRIAEKI